LSTLGAGVSSVIFGSLVEGGGTRCICATVNLDRIAGYALEHNIRFPPVLNYTQSITSVKLILVYKDQRGLGAYQPYRPAWRTYAALLGFPAVALR